MKAFFEQIDAWQKERQEIALATVVGVHGSAPRPAGARLALTRAGGMVGSVSGGCVEADVFERALAVLDDGRPTLVCYGPVEPGSLEVGLSCDGTIDLLVEPFVEDAVWREIRAATSADRLVILAIALAPATLLGRRLAVLGDGEDGADGEAAARTGSIEASLDETIAKEVRVQLRRRSRGVIELDWQGGRARIFFEAFPPDQRLYIVGANHIAIPLCRMAPDLGFAVTVIDPREAFLGGGRFDMAHAVRCEWPEAVLDEVALDSEAYVLALTHDPKFDIPTLARALRSDVRYIGALGSRGTHEKRLARLREMGFSDDELSRIRTPVGLDIGARTPDEIALSILAEMVCVRYKRRAGSMA